MDLVIIEGAGKIKKISSILGNNYKVVATCGHIEQLKRSGYDQTGIDKNLNFDFEFMNGKYNTLKEINSFGDKCKSIYIASDPDREGEGIAWHVFNKLNNTNKNKAKRITFNEISESAIKKALNDVKSIDIDYVNSYLSRVAMDIKFGFGSSKTLQQNINLPSAGRVQSVVLKLIDERTNEINNFVMKTYYKFAPKINNMEMKHFNSYNSMCLFTNQINCPFGFNSLNEINDYKNRYINKNEFKCIHIDQAKEKISNPAKPFKTSTIQTELIKKLKVNSKTAEKILQSLYQQGLISYPRTDATRISEEFCISALEYVRNKYPNLVNENFKNKATKGVQDAHECIRVVYLDKDVNNIDLSGNELIAYKIIYDNTIIQFMKPCISEIVTYNFINNKDEFSLNSEMIINQGFNEYLGTVKNDKIVDFIENKIYQIDNYNSDFIKECKTSPPAFYTQASLIKELERLGIGRPSTYASSVEVNNIRGYTKQNVKTDILEITEIGKKAIDYLNSNWSDYVNYEFTAEMEKKLDEIADGKLDFKKFLNDFIQKLEIKLSSLKNENFNCSKGVVVGKCSLCNGDLLEKISKNGKVYWKCSNSKWNPKTKKSTGCKYVVWS